ncbi:hypothetical protein BV898_09853 [Hypsibius exemplaris]|uniref:Uncharacterized protein n=1 Tax=Hypsibius exemplaris TaxID=2072580 RepID=A0A1W0WL46_HYPEX|nr:hypothetical protein BV898_09853 [Hypsibius exemplaris]
MHHRVSDLLSTSDWDINHLIAWLIIFPAFLTAEGNAEPNSVVSIHTNHHRGCENIRTDPNTGELKNEISPCPEWLPDVRVPAFCCGTATGEKTCCEWSTYVVNKVGFGRTSIGLLIFVALFFIGAMSVFIALCGLFRVFIVAGWERSDDSAAALRRTSSRSVSSGRARRSGSFTRQLGNSASCAVPFVADSV